VTKDINVKGEDVVHRALAGLHAIHGLISASLVEPDSAHVLDTVVADRSLGPAAEGRTVAAGASDVIQVIGLMAAGLGEPDDLEDVIITFGRRHHLITPLPAAGTDGLIVVVTLDREHTNLALARLKLRTLAPLVDTSAASSRVS